MDYFKELTTISELDDQTDEWCERINMLLKYVKLENGYDNHLSLSDLIKRNDKLIPQKLAHLAPRSFI